MNETTFYKIRALITHSPLHKPIMQCGAKIAEYRIQLADGKKPSYTIYIVSPYKTGTTYLDSLWNEKISKHEPFQLYSLTKLEENFSLNFRRREEVLNLKLECSGFMSLFLRKLPKANFPHKYIYIMRSPTRWITSVIKHFFGLRSIGFNYINEYYWKRLLAYDMIPLISGGKQKDLTKLVMDLSNLYFDLLYSAVKNPDISFVRLEDIDPFAIKLGEKMGIAPDFNNSWKRESKDNLGIEIPIDKTIDQRYHQFLNTIPQERLFPL